MQIAVCFVVGILTSLYGASVGGAALITLPMLIFMGLPAQQAVATALFGYLGMIVMGIFVYHKADKIEYRIAVPIAVLAVLGTCMGSWVLPVIKNDQLQRMIGIAMIGILVILLANKDLGVIKKQPSRAMLVAGYVLSFVMGMYLTTVMAGGSIIASYLLIFFFCQTLLESAGTKHLIFAGTNLSATTIFGMQGFIHYDLGCALIAGNLLGTYIGAHYALKKGDGWVRLIFVPVVLISLGSIPRSLLRDLSALRHLLR